MEERSATLQSEPDVECSVFGESAFEEELLGVLADQLGSEAVEWLEDIEALEQGDRGDDYRVILYRQSLPVQQVRRLVDTVADDGAGCPVICVVDDGDWRGATGALREGADDYLFVEQIDSPQLSATLRASFERGSVERRNVRVQQELEERSSELLGLNALANGVSSSLDREVIIRRGLWVFAGVCQQEAVALLEVKPTPRIQQVDPPDGEQSDEHLECTARFSVSGIDLIREDLELSDSWRNVIFDNHTVVLEHPPRGGEFPGLEPFWEEAPEGTITILPLRANRRAFGALVLGDPGNISSDLSLTREGLRAMARQFGSALENARLFEEVKDAYESLQETQDQLVHAEKFAAVGILAAEIAHEINNPASFVISNLSVMVEYAETIDAFLEAVEERIAQEDSELSETFQQLKADHEIEFLKDDIDALLSRSLSGMQRVHQVVQDLRYLSRDSGEDPGWLDIESLLDATVNLVKHEAKFRAELELDYAGVPQVMSDASRLSQVFLNLMVNAVQSIEEGGVDDNEITVRTERAGEDVRVTVADSGGGIPEEIQPKIFDPFFTTKETGEGTGLGLSISRDIIRSLGGEISFESKPGEGTIFRVRVPIRAEKFAHDEDLRDSGYYDMPPGLEEISDDIFD